VVGKAACAGSLSADTGDVVDFQFLNGNLKRDAGRSDPFYRTDASLKKTIRIPKAESVRIELQADALNLLNHANYQGFNAFNALSLLQLGPAGCVSCMRPNGTYAGSGGQTLHLSDITHGRISSNLLDPVFGGIGDPSTVDNNAGRQFQLSFHVRF
jgi:hypothetical protein